MSSAPGTKCLRSCRRVLIESDMPLPVHTDGEPIFLQRQMEVSLEEEKLRVIVPAGDGKHIHKKGW